MKLASIVLISCCAIAAPHSSAQDGTEQCSLDDSGCLDSQVIRQCRDRTAATIQSCTAWIQSIQVRIRPDDTVAMREIAGAHTWISMFLAMDAREQSFHRNSARAIYAAMVEKDAGDTDALMGMATVAESENERIDLLRKIASITPMAFASDLLAQALLRRDGANDVLEAAEVLEAYYRLLPKGIGWRIAAQAASHYERAGAPDRSRYIRDRIREELDATSLMAELQKIPETSSSRVAQVLEKLCDADVVAVLGATICLEGLSEIPGTLTKFPDRGDGAQFAEVVGRQVWATGTTSGWVPVTSHENWQSTISRIFTEMEAEGIESPLLLVSRAMLSEPDLDQKLRLLDRASQLVAPDDGTTLRLLADMYMVLSRPTAALAHLRRLQQLESTTDSHREHIEQQIAVLERAENAYRDTRAER